MRFFVAINAGNPGSRQKLLHYGGGGVVLEFGVVLRIHHPLAQIRELDELSILSITKF